MVNFDNDTTIARPAEDVIRMLVIEAYYNAAEAAESYKKNHCAGIEDTNSTGVLYSRIWRVWFLIKPKVTNHKTSMNVEAFEELIDTTDPDKLLTALDQINNLLYELKLTDIFGRKVYDRSNPELENEAMGL